MPFYQEIKTAKGAAIGTIMPWTGGLTQIPSGWLICDGQSVAANEFPLLAQAIGDTYNAGNSNFVGTGANSFPNYGGNIKLPNLNGKTLMDMETSYFGPRSNGGTGRAADMDIQALTLLSPLIGTNEDAGVTTIFTDVYVDLVFDIPDDDRTGYVGRIKGNTLINGDAFKTMYVGPRKLGRAHIKRHNHSGSLETIDNSSITQPGDGVVPYGDISYQIFAQGVDNDGNNEDSGDTFYFGWTEDLSYRGDSPAVTGNGESNVSLTGNGQTSDVVGGIIGASGYQTGQGPTNDLYTLEWPSAGDDMENGFGRGGKGKVMGKVASEQPPINLKANRLLMSPLTRNFINTPDFNSSPYQGAGSPIPFGVGGNTVGLPDGYTNYYTTSDASVRDTLMSNPSIGFTPDTEGVGSPILAHTHDEFDIAFDSTRMRPQSNITADVNLPQTVNLDNTANRNALQIDFNVEQPRVTSIYIIRAY